MPAKANATRASLFKYEAGFAFQTTRSRSAIRVSAASTSQMDWPLMALYRSSRTLTAIPSATFLDQPVFRDRLILYHQAINTA